jgi:hypothetical protein
VPKPCRERRRSPITVREDCGERDRAEGECDASVAERSVGAGGEHAAANDAASGLITRAIPGRDSGVPNQGNRNREEGQHEGRGGSPHRRPVYTSTDLLGRVSV